MSRRSTKQRESIRSVFEREGRPLSTGEIHELAREVIPGLGIATVYRTVKSLIEEGWLVSIRVAGTTRYERANIGHHHHFHCGECDRTFDIPGCVEGLNKLVPDHFRLISHELTLVGVCASCTTSASGI